MSDKPDHQRPEHPDFWDKRFNAGTTPWNAGRRTTGAQGLRFAETFSGQAAHADPRLRARLGGRLAGETRGWEITALDFSAAAS
jgi:hypothetical protein